MKIFVRSLLASLLALCASGCVNGQSPATTHIVVITVTNGPCAAGTAAATCGYEFSRAAATNGACPTAGNGAYTPLNSSALIAQPASGNATFTDNQVAGQTACYVGQQVQGTDFSVASNVIGPFAVPADLTAPTVSGTQSTVTASTDTPERPGKHEDKPKVAVTDTVNPKLSPLALTAEVREVK